MNDASTDVIRCEAVLDDLEHERAARFTHAAGRVGYVIARSALRRLLSGYLGDAPTAISLVSDARGKPELAGAHEGALRFSVAHSGDIALLCFSRVGVGVDVERIRPVVRADRIVARVFSEAMRARLARVPAAEWLPAFFAAWTQREAFVKAVGGTLMAARDPLDFEWPVAHEPRSFPGSFDGSRRRWTIAALPQPSGYAGAFVATGDVSVLHLFQTPP